MKKIKNLIRFGDINSIPKSGKNDFNVFELFKYIQIVFTKKLAHDL